MKTGSATGATIDPAMIFEEALRPVSKLNPNDYGWVAVWADAAGRAFVFKNEPVRDQQGPDCPHLLIALSDGLKARLFCQRVKRLDGDVGKSANVLPVLDVEL